MTNQVVPAITLIQPQPANLMALPVGELAMVSHYKTTKHRGPLAIHAGLSRQLARRPDDYSFGAVLGVIELVDVFFHRVVPRKYRKLDWAKDCKQCRSWCWVVKNPQPFDRPIRCDGQPGVWEFELDF